MLSDPRVRGWASHTAGIQALQRCCDALAPLRIEVMPLKGLWLQGCVYARAEERIITDVDVIVPEARFADAWQALERAGFVARQRNASEVALYATKLLLPIDLHRRLFMPGAFALPTHALFARGTQTTLDGVAVTLPDPIDALCHLIGHFVKSRCRPTSAGTRDFVEVMERFRLVPSEVATRLDAAGMGRAARYALHDIARRHSALAEVVTSLRPDRMGELIALACAQAGRAGQPKLGRLDGGALAGFLLERSLAAGARSLAMRALSLRQDRGYDDLGESAP